MRLCSEVAGIAFDACAFTTEAMPVDPDPKPNGKLLGPVHGVLFRMVQSTAGYQNGGLFHLERSRSVHAGWRTYCGLHAQSFTYTGDVSLMDAITHQQICKRCLATLCHEYADEIQGQARLDALAYAIADSQAEDCHAGET